jgi:hypothetical protein
MANSTDGRQNRETAVRASEHSPTGGRSSSTRGSSSGGDGHSYNKPSHKISVKSGERSHLGSKR